jgi:hypothetical protein
MIRVMCAFRFFMQVPIWPERSAVNIAAFTFAF